MRQSTVRLNYLTVQDILYINSRVTGKSLPFDYAKLEEASFGQYSYGASSDVLRQAISLLREFARIAPMTHGNVATAFVAYRAFLDLNGIDLNLPDAEGAAWVKRVLSGEIEGTTALSKLATFDSHGHDASPAAAIEAVFAAYPETIRRLA